MGEGVSQSASGAKRDAFGVYIHFPFCQARCTYCDFVFTTPSRIPQEEYTNAVLRELDARAEVMDAYQMVSIYLGGGSPSLWDPESLRRVLASVRQRFVHDDDIEVTLEANPGAIFERNLDGFLDAGVNRVSLGVQTFQAEQRICPISSELNQLQILLL